MKSLFLGLSICLLTASAMAEEPAPAAADGPERQATVENSSYVICRNGRDVRTIRVELQDGQCKALYTKEGKEEAVRTSTTPGSCYNSVNRIRWNLEKSVVWKCKHVSPERVSFSLE